MGFRHDTRHLRPDQQVIINRRDEEDKRRLYESEKRKKQEEYSVLEQLVNDGWIYVGSIQDGVSLKIDLRKENAIDKKTVELRIIENIVKAKSLFDIR